MIIFTILKNKILLSVNNYYKNKIIIIINL